MTGFTATSHGKKLLIGAILIIVAGGIGFLSYPKPAVVETDFFVPIETVIESFSMTIITPQSGGVNVHVRGTADAITRLSQKAVRIHLDNIKTESGIQTIPINARKIKLEPDVSVVSIHPPSATIRIEPLIEKKLPVVAVLTGNPATGFATIETAVNPNYVQIRGPKRIISTKTQVLTKPVDVSGVSESFRRLVALDLPEGMKLTSPDSFTVNVTVNEKIISKKLTHIPIDGTGALGAFRISPPSLTLTVKGPFRDVHHLEDNSEFTVYVDLSELKSGVYVRRAVIVLPVDIALIKTVPELFTIRIDMKE